MTSRALLLALLLSACAHQAPQASAAPAAPETTLVKPFNTEHCERLRDEGKFRVRLRNVELVNALKPLADASCFTFAVEKGIKASVTLQPSEEEPAAEWSWSEFFNAMRTELETQGVLLKEDGTRRYRVTAVR